MCDYTIISQEELAQFLVFCTGSPNIPVTDSWNLVISSTANKGDVNYRLHVCV